ncbi:MAG: family 78 glycoside hydrolase catalytic domain, partial [Saprospiraceae bacterium]|nr:family 78 glycoside hydrolase catalytic domain [Saprospiraceae bacterium]
MKNLLCAFALLFVCSVHAQNLNVSSLTCEYKTDPVGIDVAKPRLSWKLNAPGRNVLQTAYALRVAAAPDFSEKTLLWQSGKIMSGESVLQPYTGPALQSARRYYWQVQVWDNQGRASAWSQPAFWEMGLLSAADWKAQWIEPDTASKRYAPAPMLRKEFNLKKKIAGARAYVTAHGFYELHLNGQKVGDQALTPGWTVYGKRLQYQVYDVTGLLKPGQNAVGALLGDGWYRGTLGWVFQWAFYGPRLGLLCQIHVRYTNGTEEWIVSDGTWKAHLDGPIRMNDIYDGETYDARLEQPGWDLPGLADAQWQAVQVVNYSLDNLIASNGLPVRKIQELPAQRIFRTPKNELVVDFGQNLVGWVRFNVQGPAGTVVKVQHAEVLDKQGNFYTANLRKAKCRLEYTLKGGGAETYEPRFTFMGFRYVMLEGLPGDKLDPADIKAAVVHSDMPSTGAFECSNPLLNQLQHNIQWGQKGNFVDVPTDCPQRDER